MGPSYWSSFVKSRESKLSLKDDPSKSGSFTVPESATSVEDSLSMTEPSILSSLKKFNEIFWSSSRLCNSHFPLQDKEGVLRGCWIRTLGISIMSQNWIPIFKSSRKNIKTPFYHLFEVIRGHFFNINRSSYKNLPLLTSNDLE